MRPTPRSAFFFTGHLLPAELANFNVQNVFLRDRKGGVVEMMGNGVAVWWPSRPQRDFVDLADAARAWFRTIAAAYYLDTATPLEPALAGWVEARGSSVPEAMIGFADPRFIKVPGSEPDDEVNLTMLGSLNLARQIRRMGGELERATHEALAAANDGTAQTYLSAFRAFECIRRRYEPNESRRAQGWGLMWADLNIAEATELEPLIRDAALAVRHGDIPARQSEKQHPVNRARQRRLELHMFTRKVVRCALDRFA